MLYAFSVALSADPMLALHEPSNGLTPPKATDVATVEGIKGIALQWAIVNGGFGDNEEEKVEGYFGALRPIKDFAAPGDVIWEVRFMHFSQTTGVLWINQKTGKVKALR
jgi:hypothetical protein